MINRTTFAFILFCSLNLGTLLGIAGLMFERKLVNAVVIQLRHVLQEGLKKWHSHKVVSLLLESGNLSENLPHKNAFGEVDQIIDVVRVAVLDKGQVLQIDTPALS